jgi:hypothetical protein
VARRQHRLGASGIDVVHVLRYRSPMVFGAVGIEAGGSSRATAICRDPLGEPWAFIVFSDG